MQKSFFHKIEKAVFAAVGVLLAVVLILSAKEHNAVNMSRPDSDYTVVEDVSYEKIEKEDAPTGIINEYRFTLGKIVHADTLAFFLNHHNVEVYLAEECVYSLTASEGTIRTSGSFWPMIPLYEDDMGKEVRVVLIPLYSDYQDETPDFLLGSELAIYKAAFYQALPEMVLSLCVVLAGLFLLCMAIYNSVKRSSVFQIYAMSLLAVSTGVWRFTYGSFAYLLFENHAVIIYYISVISLMLVALAMLNCVELTEEKSGSKAIGICSLVYCLIDSAQLLLQIAGIFDLRQMLKATHMMIITSAAVLCFSGIFIWFKRPTKTGRIFGRSYSWLLGIGAKPEVDGEIPFTDVAENVWYTKAVIWAEQNGVVAGFTDGTFRPNDLITREQMATMLYSYAKLKGYDLTMTGDLSQFPDEADVSAWAV